ncbi:MAG: DUF2334 domain-containing protein [Candidatus Latescibacterota bacterium]
MVPLGCVAALLVLSALAGCGSSPAGPGPLELPKEATAPDSSGVPAARLAREGAFCLDREWGPAPLVVHVRQPGMPPGTLASWDFADGPATSGQPQAAHVYVRPGSYTITLATRYPTGWQVRATRRVTVLPPRVRLTGPALCRLGEVAVLALQYPLSYPVRWLAASGQVSGGEESARYWAPARPGRDRVQAVYDVEGTPFTLLHELETFRQLVVLKADDVGGPSRRWRRYLDYLREARIPSAAGIVGRDLQAAPPAWVEYLLGLQATGLFEFFHHGWDHATGRNLEGAVSPTRLYEFQGTSYAHQKAHLDRTLSLADSLGLVVTAFGAPFNKVDEVTLRALTDTPALRTVFFYPSRSPQLVLRRTADVEDASGRPNFSFFTAQYAAHTREEYLVLQVHPNTFTDEDLAQFARVVSLLVEQETTFLTPEALRLLRAGAAPPRAALRQSAVGAG